MESVSNHTDSIFIDSDGQTLIPGNPKRRYEIEQRQMIWKVEIPPWEAGLQNDPIPGLLIFSGVKHVIPKYDLQVTNLVGKVDWEILRADFTNLNDNLECQFKVILPGYSKEPNGYAEIQVLCDEAIFTPHLTEL